MAQKKFTRKDYETLTGILETKSEKSLSPQETEVLITANGYDKSTYDAFIRTTMSTLAETDEPPTTNEIMIIINKMNI